MKTYEQQWTCYLDSWEEKYIIDYEFDWEIYLLIMEIEMDLEDEEDSSSEDLWENWHYGIYTTV